MNQLAKKVICLLILMAISSPVAAIAQYPTDGPCNDNDSTCMAQAYDDANMETGKIISITRQAYAGWFAHNSQLFKIEWSMDENGLAGFRHFFPHLDKLVEQELAKEYGIVLPVVPNQKNPAGIGIAVAVGVVEILIALGKDFDETYNEGKIDAIKEDLMDQGWPKNFAETEANYQFEQIQGDNNALAGLASAVIPGIGLPVMIGNLNRDLKILGSGKYYNAWAHLHHEEVREMIQNAIRAAKGPDNGRSYMQWAAHYGNGNSDGCTGWVYEPATYNCVFNNNTATDDCTYTQGRWTCIVN